ncbi:MAG: hypothetical protein R2813_03935 [Flavobacteriales bacterium]
MVKPNSRAKSACAYQVIHLGYRFVITPDFLARWNSNIALIEAGIHRYGVIPKKRQAPTLKWFDLDLNGYRKISSTDHIQWQWRSGTSERRMKLHILTAMAQVRRIFKGLFKASMISESLLSHHRMGSTLIGSAN